MAPIGTGTVSMSDIRSEFDRTGTIKMSEMYRGGTHVLAKASDNTADNLASTVPTSGTIQIDDFRGAGKGFRYTYTAGATNQNAATLFGDDYDLNYPKEIVINSGVELGATTTSEEALEVPSGAAGSITITNNGTLTGAGGAAGQAGGDAFEAASNCTFINNGTVRAGGGGGGSGGSGGGGSVSSSYSCGLNDYGASDGCCGDRCGCTCGSVYVFYNSNSYRCYCYQYSSTNYNGGSGGSGGVGAGYNQTAGSGGSGSGGGSNAGSGGSGGSGGTFGAAGSSGNSGANGNRTNGSSGSGGGAAGKYLRGSSFVTFTNNGTVQGGTA